MSRLNISFEPPKIFKSNALETQRKIGPSPKPKAKELDFWKKTNVAPFQEAFTLKELHSKKIKMW